MAQQLQDNGCPCRGPWFDSQNTHGGFLKQLLTPVPGNQMVSSGLCGHHTCGTDLYSGKTPVTHKDTFVGQIRWYHGAKDLVLGLKT